MMQRFLIRFTALFVTLACGGSALGQEQQFTNYHCAITPPLGWSYLKVPPQHGLLVTYANRSRKSLVMLIVNDRNKIGPIDDRFIDEFDRGVEKGTKGRDQKVGGKVIEVAGLKACERLGRTTVNGKAASTWSRNIPANGIFYTIQAMCFDGKADEEPEIRQGVESFRFLGSPVPPPDPLAGKSAAYQSGYRIGRVIAPLVLVGGFVALVLILVRAFGGRGSTAPPPLPPPVTR